VLESTQMQKGCVHPCTYMQTDTTIPLLSWWAVGECGRLWVWHADFRWPKQKHEKFAKINLYYVHKFIEPLAQPEILQKDITHTHREARLSWPFLICKFQQSPPPAASTPKITANQLWQDMARGSEWSGWQDTV